MRSVLRSRRLRRVIAAYAINRLGTWFGLLALVIATYDHTHSALAVAALMFAAQALPALLVPIVVARIEARRANSGITALYLFEAIVTLALALLLSSFWFPAVLALVSIDGTAALAASALLRARVASTAREERARDAAEDAATAERLDDEAVRRANAALTLAFSTTFVIGPALAGALVAAAGASAALLIDAGSFLLGGVLIADLSTGGEPQASSARAQLAEAWSHIRAVPALSGLLIAELTALVFIETGAPIEVSFVKSTLEAGDRGLGLVLAMWGAGSILGSLLMARLVRSPLEFLLGLGTLAIGAAYLLLAITPSLEVACLAGVIGGLGNGIQFPSLVSAVQRLTPAPLQGRLMGAVESLGAIGIALGLPLGGALVAVFSPRTAFVIVGVGATLATTALVRAYRRPAASAAPGSPQEPSATAETSARARLQEGEAAPR